jgi:hypothetical protein
MAMTARGPWYQRYGNAAQIASALVALVGFGAVIVQINEIRNNNRATSARQVYLAYEDLNFRNPQFGAPDYEKLKAGDRQLLEQYKSFVSYLLYACAEVLHAFPRDASWRASCEYSLRSQLPFLCDTQSSDPKFLESFGKETVEFVTHVMVREGVSPPECRLQKA